MEGSSDAIIYQLEKLRDLMTRSNELQMRVKKMTDVPRIIFKNSNVRPIAKVPPEEKPKPKQKSQPRIKQTVSDRLFKDKSAKDCPRLKTKVGGRKKTTAPQQQPSKFKKTKPKTKPMKHRLLIHSSDDEYDDLENKTHLFEEWRENWIKKSLGEARERMHRSIEGKPSNNETVEPKPKPAISHAKPKPKPVISANENVAPKPKKKQPLRRPRGNIDKLVVGGKKEKDPRKPIELAILKLLGEHEDSPLKARLERRNQAPMDPPVQGQVVQQKWRADPEQPAQKPSEVPKLEEPSLFRDESSEGKRDERQYSEEEATAELVFSESDDESRPQAALNLDVLIPVSDSSSDENGDELIEVHSSESQSDADDKKDLIEVRSSDSESELGKRQLLDGLSSSGSEVVAGTNLSGLSSSDEQEKQKPGISSDSDEETPAAKSGPVNDLLDSESDDLFGSENQSPVPDVPQATDEHDSFLGGYSESSSAKEQVQEDVKQGNSMDEFLMLEKETHEPSNTLGASSDEEEPVRTRDNRRPVVDSDDEKLHVSSDLEKHVASRNEKSVDSTSDDDKLRVSSEDEKPDVSREDVKLDMSIEDEKGASSSDDEKHVASIDARSQQLADNIFKNSDEFKVSSSSNLLSDGESNDEAAEKKSQENEYSKSSFNLEVSDSQGPHDLTNTQGSLEGTIPVDNSDDLEATESIVADVLGDSEPEKPQRSLADISSDLNVSVPAAHTDSDSGNIQVESSSSDEKEGFPFKVDYVAKVEDLPSDFKEEKKEELIISTATDTTVPYMVIQSTVSLNSGSESDVNMSLTESTGKKAEDSDVVVDVQVSDDEPSQPNISADVAAQSDSVDVSIPDVDDEPSQPNISADATAQSDSVDVSIPDVDDEPSKASISADVTAQSDSMNVSIPDLDDEPSQPNISADVTAQSDSMNVSIPDVDDASEEAEDEETIQVNEDVSLGSGSDVALEDANVEQESSGNMEFAVEEEKPDFPFKVDFVVDVDDLPSDYHEEKHEELVIPVPESQPAEEKKQESESEQFSDIVDVDIGDSDLKVDSPEKSTSLKTTLSDDDDDDVNVEVQSSDSDDMVITVDDDDQPEFPFKVDYVVSVDDLPSEWHEEKKEELVIPVAPPKAEEPKVEVPPATESSALDDIDISNASDDNEPSKSASLAVPVSDDDDFNIDGIDMDSHSSEDNHPAPRAAAKPAPATGKSKGIDEIADEFSVDSDEVHSIEDPAEEKQEAAIDEPVSIELEMELSDTLDTTGDKGRQDDSNIDVNVTFSSDFSAGD